MVMNRGEIEEAANELLKQRRQEMKTLNKIRMYLKGEPPLMWLPSGTPRELRAFAMMSRVNMMELVPKSTTQQMFLDGYTSSGDVDKIWRIWQVNRWDKKQIGVHRAVGAYGVSYATILPGDPGPEPVLRPVSARKMTTAYGDDDYDWPVYGLEKRDDGTWRLYDNEVRYTLKEGKGSKLEFEAKSEDSHDQSVCPIVRYTASEHLDDPIRGDVEPLFALQDQINLTTFALLTAQHYGAHGQRVIIGWMAKTMEEQLKAASSTVWTIDKKPGDVDVKQLQQTNLTGYIDSREASLRHLAAIAQMPAHELLGSLANLSAAALDEAKESNTRHVAERKIVVGESHEQLLGQAGEVMGIKLDPMARVRWTVARDRNLPVLVEAIGMISEKLGVPEQVLWKELPFSQSTVEEWRTAAEEEQQQHQVPVVREVA